MQREAQMLAHILQAGWLNERAVSMVTCLLPVMAERSASVLKMLFMPSSCRASLRSIFCSTLKLIEFQGWINGQKQAASVKPVLPASPHSVSTFANLLEQTLPAL